MKIKHKEKNQKPAASALLLIGSSFYQVKDVLNVKNSVVSIIYSVVFIAGFGAPLNRNELRWRGFT